MSDWHDIAACKGLPTEWWFPNPGPRTNETAEALATCGECPARIACAQDALAGGEVNGIRGGVILHHNERKRSRDNLLRVTQGLEPIEPKGAPKPKRDPAAPRQVDRDQCLRGHPMTPDNRSSYDGRCKACQRSKQARRRERVAA